MKRCTWVEGKDEVYQRYHDTEWGVPVHNDQKLFEFIVLESAQAGLSWQTILNKREGYRKVFKNFNPRTVSKMSEREIENALLNSAIVRNRLKILATISNAKAFLATQKKFGSFSNYLWQWVDNQPIVNKPKNHKDIPVLTELAITIAKDLKKRGFKFLGPTICYAYLQAVGVINDHTRDCHRYHELLKK